MLELDLTYSQDTDALISKIKTETRKKETKLVLVEGHLISQCSELMNEIFDAMVYVDIDEKTQWKRRFSRALDLAKQYPDREGMGMDTNYEVLSVYAFAEDRERIESEVKNRRYGKDFGKLGWLKLYFDDVFCRVRWGVCCCRQTSFIHSHTTQVRRRFENRQESLQERVSFWKSKRVMSVQKRSG